MSGGAPFPAPLPRRFGIVVVPQAAVLAFRQAFGFQIKPAVFDRQSSSLFPGLCVPVDLYLYPQHVIASNIMLRRAGKPLLLEAGPLLLESGYFPTPQIRQKL
jgi:hypothetical protein